MIYLFDIFHELTIAFLYYAGAGEGCVKRDGGLGQG